MLTLRRITQHRLRLGSERGLSVLELMIALAIVAIVAAIAIPVYNTTTAALEKQDVVGELRTISERVERFYTEHGRYPDSLDEVPDIPRLDPWGNPYEYLNIAGGGSSKGNGKGKGKKKDKGPSKGKLRKDKNLVPINTDFDLYSKGPDGSSVSPLTAKPSRDDIVRASNGRYFGTASDF